MERTLIDLDGFNLPDLCALLLEITKEYNSRKYELFSVTGTALLDAWAESKIKENFVVKSQLHLENIRTHLELYLLGSPNQFTKIINEYGTGKNS